MLFYGLNPMNYTMFRPMHKRIEELSRAEVFFCFKTDNDDYSDYIRLGVPENRILSLNKSRLAIWDAIVMADFMKPRYLWTNKLIYICHGVAAKKWVYVDAKGKQHVDDYRYNYALKEYDLVFFHNEEDYRNAKQRRLFKHENSGQIVGMCCLDEIIKNNNPGKINELKIKFIAPEYREKRVLLYAPTWDETASFKRKGEEILVALSTTDCFLIVKPHPLCVTSMVGKSGLDLVTFLKEKFPKKNYLLITDTPYNIMPVADMMISDFSSISFEFTLLRKPLYLFEGNEIQNKIADNDQYEMLKKCCFVFIFSDSINKNILKYKELDHERIEAMENIQRKYFSNAGHATEVAVNKLIERKIINS